MKWRYKIIKTISILLVFVTYTLTQNNDLLTISKISPVIFKHDRFEYCQLLFCIFGITQLKEAILDIGLIKEDSGVNSIYPNLSF